VTQERHLSRIGLEVHSGQSRPESWGRKDEEYIADFSLVAKRNLDEDEYQLFRYHFLLGADWRLCSRKLHLDRGTFFHVVYRIEEKLGRVFRELKPYPLYPLDEYYHGPSRLAEPVKDNVTVMPLWSGPLAFPPVGRTA
jgi:hypothetical protein